MKQTLRFFLAIGSLIFFLLGMFLLTDIQTLIEHHKWFEGTKFTYAPTLFLTLYIFATIFVLAASFGLVLMNDIWKKTKDLDIELEHYREAKIAYRNLKDVLAKEVLSYTFKKEALHDKMIEYQNKLKELENGHTTKTD